MCIRDSYHHGGQFRQSETTLRHRPDIGTQLPQRDTAALFRHPHGKRRNTCRTTTCHRKNGEETTKTTSIKKSCRFSTSELHRRRTLIPFQPKNTLFHAQRTENFSANKNHTDIRPSRAFPRLKIQAINWISLRTPETWVSSLRLRPVLNDGFLHPFDAYMLFLSIGESSTMTQRSWPWMVLHKPYIFFWFQILQFPF